MRALPSKGVIVDPVNLASRNLNIVYFQVRKNTISEGRDRRIVYI